MVVRLLDRYEGRLPPAEDVPKLAELIWRLRPLANMAVDAEVSRALEKSANKILGDRVAEILEHMRPDTKSDMQKRAFRAHKLAFESRHALLRGRGTEERSDGEEVVHRE